MFEFLFKDRHENVTYYLNYSYNRIIGIDENHRKCFDSPSETVRNIIDEDLLNDIVHLLPLGTNVKAKDCGYRN